MRAILFAGQGSQYVGMGKDIYDRFESVKELYDRYPFVRDCCFLDEEKLSDTKYAQAAILLTSYAIASLLKDRVQFDYAAGLSLGEYSALTFTDAFSLDDAIDIVTKRAELMSDALKDKDTCMAAVLGLDAAVIESCIKEIPGICEIANYNCPGQIVITGDRNSVTIAIDQLKELGARRALLLNVSGAFHSSILSEAADKFASYLSTKEINEPGVTMVFNVSGREEDCDIKELLKQQMMSSVRFEQSIRYMIEQGVHEFIEIGPGKTLSGFVKRISKDVNVISLEHLTDIEQYLEVYSE